MLVDDPQAVPAGGDDEALVDLSERAQVGEGRKRGGERGQCSGREFTMGVGNARLGWLRIDEVLRRNCYCVRSEVESRRRTLLGAENKLRDRVIGRRWGGLRGLGDLILEHLGEFG